MTRVMGVDLGERRIGLAVSDPTGRLASPAGVVERGADRDQDHARLAAAAAELEASSVVVGLPLSLSGAEGPAARRVRAEVDELRHRIGLPVHLHDERLTTVSATRALREGGGRRRRRRGDVDQAAAAVILQAWLDGPGRL
ncbi:MAG TPA: Holliday junction resolvase RuvX [Acidimicrobiales bacterium]|nr:Holliday junction resolvase RuvX [Acidimicrobiales bacterium]